MAETHYETLKLEKNCSAQEIRSAFIKLSKEHHPDASSSSDKQNHANFVKINEAYSILSKPILRREYDVQLKMRQIPVYTTAAGHHVFRDDSFYYHPGQGDFRRAQAKPYYGIKGLKKLSNKWIVFACIIFTGVGCGLQFWAIKKSFTFSRDVLDQKSVENYNAYKKVRERATSLSKDEQFERIRKTS
ncbi:dnaJ-like protein 60 isoform X2 [Cloeon dipterum]